MRKERNSTQSYRALKSCLHITPVAPPFGGLANQTRLITTASLSHKFNLVIVRSNPERAVEKPGTSSRIFSLWPIRMYRLISKAAKKHSPDIVFIRVNGDISFLRNVFLGYLVARKIGAFMIIHLHASRRGFWHDRKVGSSQNPGFIRKHLETLGYKLVNNLLKKASAFSQLTKEIDQYYQSIGLRSATHIIPDAVVLNKPELLHRKPNRFLFVGRLSREKGFFDLLEALVDLADTNWIIDVLGSPTNKEDMASINNILDKHPHKNNIKLHGTIEGDAKLKFFDTASFLVLPTHLEVFPNVVLEAMAAEQAVITTPIGEIENMLPTDGGLLVEPGDCKALSNAISVLLHDPQRARSMGRINREKVSKYSLETVSTQFEKMLQGIISDEKEHK